MTSGGWHDDFIHRVSLKATCLFLEQAFVQLMVPKIKCWRLGGEAYREASTKYHIWRHSGPPGRRRLFNVCYLQLKLGVSDFGKGP